MQAYNDVIQKVMDSKAIKKHYGQKEEMFFKNAQFGDIDLVPILEEMDLSNLGIEEDKDLIVAAANLSVEKGESLTQDMTQLLTPFMKPLDQKIFAANCKFGDKKLRVGEFHHGIARAQMKLIEDLN